MSILARILERKRAEVAALRPRAAELARAAAAAPPARDFAGALRAGPAPRVIAEFKRASPSLGPIRPGAEPAEIARQYAAAGACALSVLTDRDFFQGSLDDLRAARAACALPVLRKDFVVDALQLTEARAAGADAVLLIAAALEDAELRDLAALAKAHGMTALVEVHTRAELERARAAGADCVGVNNRDLATFRTDVGVTRALLAHAQGLVLVSESGLGTPQILAELGALGASAFLIGEALMRAPDPGAALARLRGSAQAQAGRNGCAEAGTEREGEG